MYNKLDQKIKSKLSEEVFIIPESYDARFEETVSRIESKETSGQSKIVYWVRNYKIASIILLLLSISAISGTAIAGINRYQKRMDSMPKEVKEKYAKEVQSVNVDADCFSRKLTVEERKMMDDLRNEYMKGRIPAQEITSVKTSAQVTDNNFCFVVEESKFYLPKSKLTEEQVLEIIDLQEKRAYSIREKNENAVKENQTDVTGDESVEIIAKNSVAKLYNINHLKVDKTTKLDSNGYEVDLSDRDNNYTVLLTEHKDVEQMDFTRSTKSSHSPNVSINKVKKSKIIDMVKEKVTDYTGKSVTDIKGYAISDGKKMVYGTVSYYITLSDGTGCVAVYSVSYGDIYEMQLYDNARVLENIIREKKRQTKKMGYKYIF